MIPIVPLTLDSLINCFNRANEFDMKYVAVAVNIHNSDSNEIIINTRENFESKLEYYKTVYDEDLNHRHADGISIVGFTFGDTFAEIEEDLIG
jgi:hypothetical protein